MDMSSKTYKQFTDAHAPRSAVGRNCLRAFWVGGLICVIGQGFSDLYVWAGMDKDDAGLLASCTLVLFAVVLTALGAFDRIAKYAGGGTLVPITGFANAVASPAIDARAEGLILGVGAKIFTVAGPVLLYGTLAGVLYGAVYWVVRFVTG